jgi:predicted HTH transcriptional regulator
LKKPEFIQEADFSVILYCPKVEDEKQVGIQVDTDKDTENAVGIDINRIKQGTETAEKITENDEKVTKNQQLMLDSIIRNPHITLDELAKIAGISLRKIKENISKLKDKGLLERIGANKSGYWKVIKKD